jgi:hypothetical protein
LAFAGGQEIADASAHEIPESMIDRRSISATLRRLFNDCFVPRSCLSHPSKARKRRKRQRQSESESLVSTSDGQKAQGGQSMTRRNGEIPGPTFGISDRTIRPASREDARPQE